MRSGVQLHPDIVRGLTNYLHASCELWQKLHLCFEFTPKSSSLALGKDDPWVWGFNYYVQNFLAYTQLYMVLIYWFMFILSSDAVRIYDVICGSISDRTFICTFEQCNRAAWRCLQVCYSIPSSCGSTCRINRLIWRNFIKYIIKLFSYVILHPNSN